MLSEKVLRLEIGAGCLVEKSITVEGERRKRLV